MGDTRRWLIRKDLGGMGCAPFDSKKASIIGPDTEPIELAPAALLEQAAEIISGLVFENNDSTTVDATEWLSRTGLGPQAPEFINEKPLPVAGGAVHEQERP